MKTEEKLRQLEKTATALEIAINSLRRDIEQLKGRQEVQSQRIDQLSKEDLSGERNN
jgi:peptidoglycan hydrolase CwlO-like protein